MYEQAPQGHCNGGSEGQAKRGEGARLTKPPTMIIPIDVLASGAAAPLTIETISSSWLNGPVGGAGSEGLTGVKARPRATCNMEWQYISTSFKVF